MGRWLVGTFGSRHLSGRPEGRTFTGQPLPEQSFEVGGQGLDLDIGRPENPK